MIRWKKETIEITRKSKIFFTRQELFLICYLFIYLLGYMTYFTCVFKLLLTSKLFFLNNFLIKKTKKNFFFTKLFF